MRDPRKEESKEPSEDEEHAHANADSIIRTGGRVRSPRHLLDSGDGLSESLRDAVICLYNHILSAGTVSVARRHQRRGRLPCRRAVHRLREEPARPLIPCACMYAAERT